MGEFTLDDINAMLQSNYLLLRERNQLAAQVTHLQVELEALRAQHSEQSSEPTPATPRTSKANRSRDAEKLEAGRG